MDRIAELFADAGRTSTQEQAWLLMAAEAAAQLSGGTMNVAVDGAAPQTAREPLYFRRALGAGAPPMTVANRGNAPAWRTSRSPACRKADLPAENNGYAVSRAMSSSRTARRPI